MNKFRPLKADEIECRISTVSDKGVSLLLYKTARTDANLLDETVGAENWENDFKVVDSVLYGGIGIYDQIRDEMIWKWDAGTESYTEAEKGRASDAFKRAGFKWGIGRELYSSPSIWITEDKCTIEDRKGKKACYDNFRVTEIGYSESGDINKLVIANDKKGVDVFHFQKNARKPGNTANSSQDVKVQGNGEESSQNANTAVKQPIEAPDGYYYCEKCGTQLQGTTLTNGKKITHSEVAKMTIKKYGLQLCPECCKNAKPVA